MAIRFVKIDLGRVVPAGECRCSCILCIKKLLKTKILSTVGILHETSKFGRGTEFKRLSLNFSIPTDAPQGYIGLMVIILSEEAREVIKMMIDLGYIDEITLGYISIRNIEHVINSLMTF